MAFRMLAFLALFACLFNCLGARELYVFSQREGCVSVQSNATCPVSWKLDPYSAKLYESQIETVSKAVMIYKTTGADCQENLRNVLCSQYIPRCHEDGRRDYGAVRAKCEEELYTTCPSAVVETLKRSQFCRIAKTGEHPRSNCVAPSRRIEGICPQPKYKMPHDFLMDYEKESKDSVESFENIENLKNVNGARVFSSACVLKLEQIICSPVYCSEDEKQLLIETDREDCNDYVTKCFEEPISHLQMSAEDKGIFDILEDSLKTSCNIYPQGSTGQKQQAPPTISPISLANCQVANFGLLLCSLFTFLYYLSLNLPIQL